MLKCLQMVTLLFLTHHLLGIPTAQGQEKWRIRNRLQTTYEFDSNIRENPILPIKDSSIRLLFNSRASKTTQRARLLFAYSGGLQTYFQNSIENKLVNELDASGAFRLGKWSTGLRLSGRLKLYLNDTLDYSTGSAQFFIQLPPLLRLTAEVSAKATDVKYQNFPQYDYSIIELRWRLARKLSARLTGTIELAAREIDYLRTVVLRGPDGSTEVYDDLNLEDNNILLQAQLNYSKSFLLNISYVFENNHSRVPDYAFRKHQIIAVFGLPLTAGIWLRSYGALQLKRYSEDSILASPVDIDTEREESNFIVIDFSRDLSSSLTALVRVAFYNNESIARGFFYHKTLLSAGFDYRF